MTKQEQGVYGENPPNNSPELRYRRTNQHEAASTVAADSEGQTAKSGAPSDRAPVSNPPHVYAEAARLQAHKLEREGDTYYCRGQFPQALDRYQNAVREYPLEARCHYKIGSTAQLVDQKPLVEKHLLEAIRIDPRFAHAHSALSHWYAGVGILDKALRYGNTARALDPNDPDILSTHAYVLGEAKDSTGVWNIIEPLISRGVIRPWVALAYFRIAKEIGREKEAAAFLRKALAAPEVSTDEKSRMQFALVSLLDQLGEYEEAMRQARIANSLVPKLYDPKSESQRISNKIAYFSRAKIKSLPRATHDNRRPVFIVGMPRSGTSLVEQILASHPAVFGGGELDMLYVMAYRMLREEWAVGTSYPDCLQYLSARRANKLAQDYLSIIESLNSTCTYVTDKLPANFLYLELVELLLPGCHVIHCTRGALDTCLSCYFTGFAQANEFSFNMAHLGSFYRDYQRLMDHWKRVLNLSIFEMRYEDLVLDTHTQVRRLLEYLELPWDDRCMKFFENKRRVNTASVDQVRRPIYTSSIGRWKRYESHLTELIVALRGGD